MKSTYTKGMKSTFTVFVYDGEVHLFTLEVPPYLATELDMNLELMPDGSGWRMEDKDLYYAMCRQVGVL